MAFLYFLTARCHFSAIKQLVVHVSILEIDIGKFVDEEGGKVGLGVTFSLACRKMTRFENKVMCA